MDRALKSIGRFGAHMSVKSRTTGTPPGSPANGDGYIVPTGATGAWSAQTDKIAVYDGSAWVFKTPLKGWQTFVDDELLNTVYSGSSWSRKLNDSGSWTPVFAGSTTAGITTYTTQVGQWIAQGKTVFASFQLVMSATTGVLGNLTITGFPAATTDNTGNKNFQAALTACSGLTGVSDTVYATVIPTISSMNLIVRNPNTTNLTASNLSGGAVTLEATVMYIRD
jgi:hypothetical protein